MKKKQRAKERIWKKCYINLSQEEKKRKRKYRKYDYKFFFGRKTKESMEDIVIKQASLSGHLTKIE